MEYLSKLPPKRKKYGIFILCSINVLSTDFSDFSNFLCTQRKKDPGIVCAQFVDKLDEREKEK